MRTDHTDAPAGCEYATIYVAFELSKAKWQLGIMVPGAEKMSRYRIEGGNLTELSTALGRARARAEQLGKPVRVLSCYEAGLDGHWLHREDTQGCAGTREGLARKGSDRTCADRARNRCRLRATRIPTSGRDTLHSSRCARRGVVDL